MTSSTEATPLLPPRRRLSHFQRRSSFHSTSTSHVVDSEKESPNKLGTFDGVFIPTALNVLSILMFLRFGFIIGQMGLMGSFLLLFMSYAIDLLTTLSISAIATNGTVRGGGAYYMISRSLGPEFGGSIGLVFYIGQVLNSGMNVVGFIEPLLINLGDENGVMAQILPQGYWWEFLYSTILLFLCICIALVGSQLVSKAGYLLFFLLLFSTISVPLSALFVKPFSIPEFDLTYTGPSWETLKGNMMPHFTKGAAGSLLSTKETFNDLFGIFFPATAGIFAGASMSGDLSKPSNSIPKGTLWGLLLTFVCYSLVIISLSASVPRELLHKDVQIIQTVSMSSTIILIGEFSTSLFSVIMGIVGGANVLQAIAKDAIIPGLGLFSKVDPATSNPIPAVLITWLLTQMCLFANINQIATFITMAFLMTFIVTNLACFLLKIAAAPNFRPSFRYFDWYTALMGLIACVIAMFIVDGISATLVVIFLTALFLFIHYVCPPKPWGDVSQSLIYHQVRKYLLRLRQDNVKYWRPQILLLVDSPRSSWNLIHFCNHLKKGGLYILGHVIVTESFQNNFHEFKRQENAWIKLRDISKIKAFVQIGLGPTLPWGVRNVILGSGLGGMKPNIVVLGFFDMERHYPKSRPETVRLASAQTVDVEQLPTDECRNEKRVSIQNWVSIIEDMLLMRTNIAVAKGFEKLHVPTGEEPRPDKKKFIDLYPIQMSAEVVDKNGEKSAMTTNFDTYTLILQLGAILRTVPQWKRTHQLRIVVFVEDPEDMENERERVQQLVEVLRIKTQIVVVCLKSFKTYNTIVKGNTANFQEVDKILEEDDWWIELKEARMQKSRNSSAMNVPTISINTPHILDGLEERKYNISKLQKMGLSFSMTTNKLLDDGFLRHVESDSDSDYESTYSGSDTMRSQDYKNPQNSRRAHIDAGSTRPLDESRTSLASSTSRQLKKVPSSSSTLTTPSKTKKNTRPNFSSEKIPRSKVIDDATGDQPSIMLLPDQSKRNSKSNKKSTPASVDGSVIIEEENDQQSSEQVELSINELSFNDLPAKAQHLILNDLMKTISSDAHVIFSTLPAPVVGTHYSEDDCKEYMGNLQTWCDGLPPIMLINSQSMTVTTAL
ncbi:Vacuolar cation-chloride cotransporter 1 [Cyberlindnera fabianii]|uniref:Vacuolar cation-chloride cotransporter 1 n=1 Tax=Cyberlindnera fabianii TaxID=36022 RepID=A0A1V2L755_CYBFA|nr:Vacuolar cation-chloride cotransporter 1 [Cyberlindnera fabianii]